MHLALHKLRIHLQSDETVINRHWRQLFGGWLESRRGIDRTGALGADICLQLALAEALPPLPGARPIFSDSHHLPDGVGILSVYQGEGERVLLHYLDGAVVSVPLYSEQRDFVPTATGIVTPAALDYGRFEDVTFTSLAPLLRRQGYFLVHAFAASKDGRALLIVGPTGSGKTTTGLSLLLAGWRLLSNDVLLLEERPDAVYALPTPGGVGIRPQTLELLPQLQTVTGDTPLVRNLFNLTSRQLADGRWSKPAPVSAIAFAQIEDKPRATRQPMNRAICLARLMEESIDRWDEAIIPAHINLLQKLSCQANAYTLRLGRDVERLPQLLKPESGFL